MLIYWLIFIFMFLCGCWTISYSQDAIKACKTEHRLAVVVILMLFSSFLLMSVIIVMALNYFLPEDSEEEFF